MEGPPLLPGFTVGRRIGSDDSAMWLATDDATGTAVTLRRVAAADPATHEKVRSAVTVLRELDHPHLARVLDIADTPAGPVLILEGAAGGSLADIVAARGPLPPGEVVTACAPIAEGLAEIHPHSIYHGAITIDDVVFTLEGRPMLAGVGLVQVGAGRPSGIPAGWAAPETLAGHPAGPPADVFGLATVVVVGLTGYLPRQPLLLGGVPAAAEAALGRGLERVVDRRPNSSALVGTLYAVGDPTPVELVVGDISQTHATGLLPTIEPEPPTVFDDAADAHAEAAAADDIASFMRRRSTGTGRRARRAASSPTPAPEPPPTSIPPPSSAPTPASDRAPGADTLPGANARSGATAPEPAEAAAPPMPRRRRAAESRRARPDETRPPAAETEKVAAVTSAAATPGTSRSATADAEPKTAAEGATTSRPGRQSRQRRQGGRTAGKAPRGAGGSGLRSKIDATKVAIAVAVLLVGAGIVVVVAQFVGGGDEDLPSAGLGVPSGGSSEPPVEFCGGPQPAPTAPPPTVTDWTQEIERLYTLRAEAFAEVDAERLCQVYAPTSQGLVEDAQRLQDYADAGARAQGLQFEVITAEVISQTGGRVVLEIFDRMPPYTLVDDDGEVVGEIGGVADQSWQAELVPVADEGGETTTWRFG